MSLLLSHSIAGLDRPYPKTAEQMIKEKKEVTDRKVNLVATLADYVSNTDMPYSEFKDALAAFINLHYKS